MRQIALARLSPDDVNQIIVSFIRDNDPTSHEYFRHFPVADVEAALLPLIEQDERERWPMIAGALRRGDSWFVTLDLTEAQLSIFTEGHKFREVYFDPLDR